MDNREFRVRLDGPLDCSSALEVRPVVDEVAAAEPCKVWVDIAAVDFIDSSGVALLVSLFKRVRDKGGSMTVVGAQRQPLAVLKLLSIDRLLCGEATEATG